MDQDQFSVFIDIHKDTEWQQGHLPQTHHLERCILEQDIKSMIDDKTIPIILYRSGSSRSILAAESLQKMDYTQVFSMAGG